MPHIPLSEYLYQRIEEEKVEGEGFNSVSEAVRHIVRENLDSENGGEQLEQ
jgi:Arc/MetJ-type ribon-helix-helix transcriptional regulator